MKVDSWVKSIKVLIYLKRVQNLDVSHRSKDSSDRIGHTLKIYQIQSNIERIFFTNSNLMQG